MLPTLTNVKPTSNDSLVIVTILKSNIQLLNSFSHQMIHGFLKRRLISGLGKEMLKIILGIMKDQKAEGLQKLTGTLEKF